MHAKAGMGFSRLRIWNVTGGYRTIVFVENAASRQTLVTLPGICSFVTVDAEWFPDVQAGNVR
jgi:hypothetical protein